MSSNRALFRSARETISRLGVVNGLLFALSRVAHRWSGSRCRLYKYDFVAQPVVRSSTPGTAGPIAIEVVGAHDALVKQFPRPVDVIARRFEDNAICLAARHGDDFVGYIWLKLHGYDEDEVRCRYLPLPEDRTAWDFDMYVSPTYRMSRVFAHLWREANTLLAAHGVEWVLSRISAFNVESRRAHERLGIRRVGSAVFLCIGSFQGALLSVSPYVHVSFIAASRPVIRLQSPAG